MDGMLSQEEINALLNSMNSTGDDEYSNDSKEELTMEEKDAIGEISNISMGTAATTLSKLVNRKVLITTPKVESSNWTSVTSSFDKPCVYIEISYKEGLQGNNILLLKETDVMMIADLMMGGNGDISDGEVTDLHLSAISEAMNQMMGSASTSLSSMIEKTVDISPPEAHRVLVENQLSAMYPLFEEPFVKVSFKMEIGDIIDSEIMQLYSTDFAKDLYQKFGGNKVSKVEENLVEDQMVAAPTMDVASISSQPMNFANEGGQYSMEKAPQQEVNVSPVQFQPFHQRVKPNTQPENIDLIMDVPLEVTVELGRTTKSIKEILDFSPGSIIELNKLAGEPIDVLVNGKNVAKGEVVVIEESFGIRITDIIK